MFAVETDPELALLRRGDHSDEYNITDETNHISSIITTPIITDSPRSAAEHVEPHLSREDQSDNGQEEPCVFDFPDSTSSSSQFDSEVSGSGSPSHTSSVEQSSTIAVPAPSASGIGAIESARNIEDQTSQTNRSSHSLGLVPTIGQNAAPTVPPQITFWALLSILKEKAEMGQYQIFFSDLKSEFMRLHHASYEGLEVYVREAKEANMVEIGVFRGREYVQLVDTGSQWCPRRELVPLVDIMRTFLADGVERPRRMDVAPEIYRKYPGVVWNFKEYISRAEDAGVVRSRKVHRLELANH